VKIGIDSIKRIIVEKRKDADRSGISIGTTGIARSSFIVGRRISNSPLSEIVLSATVMTGMTGPIGTIVIMIGDSMGRLGGEHPFVIGWGAGSVCTTGLAIVFNISPGTRKSLKRWLMRGFPMSSFSAETPILIGSARTLANLGISNQILRGKDHRQKSTWYLWCRWSS